MKKIVLLIGIVFYFFSCGNSTKSYESSDLQSYDDTTFTNDTTIQTSNSYYDPEMVTNEQGYVDLKANVACSMSEIVITNNSKFDYLASKLILNDDYFVKNIIIKSGETATINLFDFADSDGNRFSSMKKPQSLNLFCKLENGKDGFVSAIWE